MIYDSGSKSQIGPQRDFAEHSQIHFDPIDPQPQKAKDEEVKSCRPAQPTNQQQNSASNRSKQLVKLMLLVKLDGFGFDRDNLMEQVNKQIDSFDAWDYIKNAELNDLAEFLAAKTLTHMFTQVFGNGLVGRIRSRRASLARFDSDASQQPSQEHEHEMRASESPIVVRQANHEGQLPSIRPRVEILCHICYTPNSRYVQDECGHTFCKDCMRAYVRECIVSGNYLISCPEYECQGNVSTDIVRKVLPKKEFQKFEYFLEKTKQEMDPDNKFCSKPDCGQILSLVEDRYFCPKCETQYCQTCLQPYHEGRDCNTTLRNALQHTYTVFKIKKCPKCTSPIEKTQGCNHMVCKKCKYEFCWLCLSKYSRHHYRYYNCLGCPGMMFEEEDNYMAERCKQVCFWTILPFMLLALLSAYVCFIPVYMVGMWLYMPVGWIREEKKYCEMSIVKCVFCWEGVGPTLANWLLLQPRGLLYGLFVAPVKLTMMVCHQICRSFD